jgi:hypothetical protein
VVPFPDGRDGPPEVVGVLGIPAGDESVRGRQVDQGEEARAVTDAVEVLVDDCTDGSRPDLEDVVEKEIAEVGLLGGAGAAEAGTQILDLVVFPPVPPALQA